MARACADVMANDEVGSGRRRARLGDATLVGCICCWRTAVDIGAAAIEGANVVDEACRGDRTTLLSSCLMVVIPGKLPTEWEVQPVSAGQENTHKIQRRIWKTG